MTTGMAGSISELEAARLAHQSYFVGNSNADSVEPQGTEGTRNRRIERRPLLPDGWAIQKSCTGSFNTCYTVFEHKVRKQLVMAIRGTDSESWANIVNDLALFTSARTGVLAGQVPFGQSGVENDIIVISKNLEKTFTSVRDVVRIEPSSSQHDYLETGTPSQFSAMDDNCKDEASAAENLGMKFTIVGHSLGAVHAQLGAIYAGVDCITFENPGVRDIVDKTQKYKDALTKNPNIDMRTYQSAPNIFNTVSGQIGKVYRLRLPHIKVGSWHMVIKMFYQLACPWWHPIEWLGPFVNLVLAPLGTIKVLLAEFCQYLWLIDQHSILHIVEYLSNADNVRVEMESWPLQPTIIMAEAGRLLINLVFHMNGLKDDDAAIEAKIQAIRLYNEK